MEIHSGEKFDEEKKAKLEVLSHFVKKVSSTKKQTNKLLSEDIQHILATPVKGVSQYRYIHRYFKRWSINPTHSQD